jgi:Outer membrane protein beta-barrel domain
MRAIVSWTVFWLTILTAIAQGQRFEVTGSIGGQVNGSLDLSTVLLQGIDVQNSITRSAGISYEPNRHSAVEFMWNYSSPGVVSQPIAGGLSAKAFNLDMNQYFGNLLFHFVTREPKLRPFILGGLGVSSLSTAQNGVKGTTRFVFALGGGVKYNFARHFGLRLQAKWSPTYLSTTQIGYWCDPGWGGCWATNRNHYLNGLNFSAGLTFRF